MFAALVENSSDFIGVADAAGKGVYLNPAGRRMVGLTPEFAVEHTEVLEYYPPDQRAFASDVILKSMIEQGHWEGETAFRHWESGKAIPVSDTHFMIREPGTGRLLGWGTITRDISELKRAQEEAERLRQQLEAVARASARISEAVASLPERERADGLPGDRPQRPEPHGRRARRRGSWQRPDAAIRDLDVRRHDARTGREDRTTTSAPDRPPRTRLEGRPDGPPSRRAGARRSIAGCPLITRRSRVSSACPFASAAVPSATSTWRTSEAGPTSRPTMSRSPRCSPKGRAAPSRPRGCTRPRDGRTRGFRRSSIRCRRGSS